MSEGCSCRLSSKMNWGEKKCSRYKGIKICWDEKFHLELKRELLNIFVFQTFYGNT